MRELLRYVAISLLAGALGTFAAVILYLVIVLHETPAADMLGDAWIFGAGPAIRSVFFSIPAGVALYVVSRRVAGPLFVISCAACGGLLGVSFGLWLVRPNAPHVSNTGAAVAAGIAWCLAAFAAAFLRRRSPN